ncbi:MAG: glutamate 5-kinase, partial [Ruminococcaceae bacterium]|nr:glutamate 5-kinase [Oscillospiraceae bacterium]
AVGQCELMYTYDKMFAEYNHTVAQLLITNYVINNSDMAENFKNTLNRLIDMEVIPIINENDTVSTAEIGIGDNDTLGAIVTVLSGADLLILLSDIDGLFTADPHKDKNAQLISEITCITDEIRKNSGGAGSVNGTGGMVTKLNAADMCMKAGCDMIIANGAEPKVLYDIMEGKSVGSRFVGRR